MQVTYDRSGRVTALDAAGLSPPHQAGGAASSCSAQRCGHGFLAATGGPGMNSAHRAIGPDSVRITSPLEENVHEAHPGLCSRHRLRLRSPRLDDGQRPGRPDTPAPTAAPPPSPPPAPTPRTTPALGTGQGLVVRDTVRDANGASHVRFDRTYRGLPVVGGDLVVHQTRGDAFRSVSGRALSPSSSPPRAVGHRQDRHRQGRARSCDFAKAARPRPELVVLADLRHAGPGLARRRHRPQRRRLARRRVRLRQRPEGRRPRPAGRPCWRRPAPAPGCPSAPCR